MKHLTASFWISYEIDFKATDIVIVFRTLTL